MKADIRFDDRVVVVTGAGNGLGRSYALELGRRGALVVVNDYGGSTDGTGGGRRAADLVLDEIVTVGGRAVASYDSVRQDAGCRNIAALALEAGGRIDAVIHNAGIARNTRLYGMDDEHWFPVIDTHLLGGFYLARAAWPAMVDAGYGRFVITSSATGMWGRAEGANYAGAKAGLTHRYYSALRGRYVEIFVAVNDGWVAPAGEPPTVEELAAHLDIVEDRSAYSVPHDSLDEVLLARPVR